MNLFSLKKGGIIYNHHHRFQETGTDGPKPTVTIAITVGSILKTYSDCYIFKKNQKIVLTLGFELESQGPK